MAYFSDHYDRLCYLPRTSGTGLYNAQLGAIHAVAAHFTVDEQPAIVTMPTGSGKTAVLMMTPFVLRSRRVLVITPSRLVREQITEDFNVLLTLKQTGTIPTDLPTPRVLQVKNRIGDTDDWEALRDYDVIVSTPNCTSPTYEEIPVPPEDLFDLILIDEAHHSSAQSWDQLLHSFPGVRKVLFTATPFRRDRGEIRGRFVYTYPVSKAYEDRIFGKIRFVPAQPNPDEPNDVVIARLAELTLQSDREAGLNHYLMVRTDRLTRAAELAGVYQEHTNLRLERIHSNLSNRRVKSILRQLSDGELDGIICVNMLGEGFNFPRLKIAAIHSPHRSLEVTLQFIGRFARTNAPDIGDAKFIAVPSEIEIEGRRLFEEGAIWQTLVEDLSHGRIAEELRIREELEHFASAEAPDIDLSDLSLYSLYPRSHVKVYNVSGLPVDLAATLPIQEDETISYRNLSDDRTTAVIIFRQSNRPKWSSGDHVVDTEHLLLVIFHDRDSELLFVNSSKSVDGLYDDLIEVFCPGATTLSTSQIRRVVKDLGGQRIFNLGMRNIQPTNAAESYRIIAGSDTQATIKPSDARLYRQGHVFLSGEEASGQRVTIGYSSGSKVWATSQLQIPDLLEWCKELGRKIRSQGDIVSNNGLDYLSTGEIAASLPPDVVVVGWPREAFDFEPPVRMRYTGDDSQNYIGHITDLDLTIDPANTNDERIRIIVAATSLRYEVEFTLEEFYAAVNGDSNRIEVTRGNNTTSLIDYLNSYYLNFFTASGAVLAGNELCSPGETARPIDVDQLEPWDWTGVQITAELTAENGLRSVQEELQRKLEAEDCELIVCDHGTGEVADYLTLTRRGSVLEVALYHCKGSSEAQPGARVNDVHVVCGQAQKSAIWRSLPKLEKRLLGRVQSMRFVRGTEEDLRSLLNTAKTMRQAFSVAIVQPGVSRRRLTPALSEALGATNDHVIAAGFSPLRVISSE